MAPSARLPARGRDGAVDLDALRERASSDGGAVEPGARPPRRQLLRTEHDLPPERSDDAAETVLSAALESAAGGDVEAAADRLRAEFPTVCEHRRPELRETEPGHGAARHRHGPHG